METSLPPLRPVDHRRLPADQAPWVEALAAGCFNVLAALSGEERMVYAQVWQTMARTGSPVVTRAFGQVGQAATGVQQVINRLNTLKLLWFDDDLRAVLQCPPFSALHTPHEVKAFGWERAYACSFIDVPPMLLMYGPNVWLQVTSRCPRSGERLSFRVRMSDDYHLHWEAPLNAWQVWLPTTQTADAWQEFHALRPRVHAFCTPQDLDTHRQYHATVPGAVYTLDQSMYLSEILLQTYRLVIAPS